MKNIKTAILIIPGVILLIFLVYFLIEPDENFYERNGKNQASAESGKANSVPKRPSPSTNNNVVNHSARDFFENLEGVADQRALEEIKALCSEIGLESLLDKASNKDSILESSRRFLTVNKSVLSDDKYYKQTCYWYVNCLSNALKSDGDKEAEYKNVIKSLNQLQNELTLSFSESIESTPKHRREEIEKFVNSEMRILNDTIKKRLLDLRDDPLCPLFKHSISTSMIKQSIDRVCKTRTVPNYKYFRDEDHSINMLKLRLESYTKNSGDVFLYYVTYYSLRKDLLENSPFGKMNYESTMGHDIYWPITVFQQPRKNDKILQ